MGTCADCTVRDKVRQAVVLIRQLLHRSDMNMHSPIDNDLLVLYDSIFDNCDFSSVLLAWI